MNANGIEEDRCPRPSEEEDEKVREGSDSGSPEGFRIQERFSLPKAWQKHLQAEEERRQGCCTCRCHRRPRSEVDEDEREALLPSTPMPAMAPKALDALRLKAEVVPPLGLRQRPGEEAKRPACGRRPEHVGRDRPHHRDSAGRQLQNASRGWLSFGARAGIGAWMVLMNGL